DVRPASAYHLEAIAKLDHTPFGQLDMASPAHDLAHLHGIVIARTDVTTQAGAVQSLVGQRHPLLNHVEHLLVEEGIDFCRVSFEFRQLFGGYPERVIAP